MSKSSATTTITPQPMIFASIFYDCNPDATTLATYQASAADLAGSGFTTVNLWQFHVDTAGNLLYNAASPGPALISAGALQSGFSYVPGLISTLTGGKVTKIRATIGGWGLDNTFNNIAQLFAEFGSGPDNPLYSNFVALNALGVTGIDLDLEPAGGQNIHDYPYYIGPLSQLITMVAGLGMDVTFCPYQNENFWLVLLAAVYAENNGQQPVQSMNVQCYSGGVSNTQQGWIAGVNAYPSLGLNVIDPSLGIADPTSFVVPGFGVMVNKQPECPPYFQQQLTASGFASAGITAAYLFTYENIQTAQQNGNCAGNNTTADYANALIAGINAVNGVS